MLQGNTAGRLTLAIIFFFCVTATGIFMSAISSTVGLLVLAISPFAFILPLVSKTIGDEVLADAG